MLRFATTTYQLYLDYDCTTVRLKSCRYVEVSSGGPAAGLTAQKSSPRCRQHEIGPVEFLIRSLPCVLKPSASCLPVPCVGKEDLQLFTFTCIAITPCRLPSHHARLATKHGARQSASWRKAFGRQTYGARSSTGSDSSTKPRSAARCSRWLRGGCGRGMYSAPWWKFGR